MHVVDFALFMRFAASDADALSTVNDLGGGAAMVSKAKVTVQRQARAAIALKRRHATAAARATAEDREG